MNSDLVEKIRKLLALSRSDNEHEAALALQRAQEIAINNGISIAAVQARGDNAESYDEKRVESGQRFAISQRFTTAILMNHFKVHIIYWGNRQHGRSITFLGKESDVEIAIYLQEYLNKAFMDIWRANQKKYGWPVKNRDAFLLGLYHGLNTKLTNEARKAEEAKFEEIRRQKDAAGYDADLEVNKIKNNYAIILKTDEVQLKKYVEDKHPELRKVQNRKLNIWDSDVVEIGQQEGAKMEIRRGLKDNRSATLKLN